VSAEKCAFMVAHTNGILCAPLTAARAAELELPPMVVDNRDKNQTVS
jgi:3,4-dihydroxy 2-butanone 4-phosphate synthase / GTP cyclohydrolase II